MCILKSVNYNISVVNTHNVYSLNDILLYRFEICAEVCLFPAKTCFYFSVKVVSVIQRLSTPP